MTTPDLPARSGTSDRLTAEAALRGAASLAADDDCPTCGGRDEPCEVCVLVTGLLMGALIAELRALRDRVAADLAASAAD